MPLVHVTDAARQTLLDMRAAETDGDGLALRIDVIGVGVGGREYSYELLFDRIAEAGPDDNLATDDALPVLIPAASIDKLRGATLDHVEPTGLVLRNPNRPSPSIPWGETDLVGTPEEKLRMLLEAEINPSLAAHGGYAELKSLEDDVAYVFMGGGCQGCGLAALTLTEGIKATIEKRIPEIREVIDVTDHAAGENPFYEASAK